MYESIFGPVISSRLGRSLGVDLLGGNICSFDCLYCESGKTRIKTVNRAPHADPEKIVRELETWFGAGKQRPDYITLGGPGEPCLNAHLGDIISSVKALWPDIPLAVLTNSSLLSSREVRSELLKADAVLPSLDSMVEKEFIRINRPHPDIRLQDIVQGLLDFRQCFDGRIFLEILLIPEINDSETNFNLLRDFCGRLKPDRVDVAAMSRPGAHIDAIMPDERFLERWRREFCTPSWTGHCPEHRTESKTAGLREMIAASIRRRPQTPEQLAAALGAAVQDVQSVLLQMERAEEVESTANDNANKFFYIKRG